MNVAIDEGRRIDFVNFGEVEASHARAVEFMRRYAEIRIKRRFKTIVTTSAGYPLDKTYYQTVKGMVGVMDILAPGGTIIIAASALPDIFRTAINLDGFVMANRVETEGGVVRIHALC